MQRSKTLLYAAPAVLLGAALASASSHREAPFVTETPKVDGTDFYMFTSYEAGREDYVTLVANYLPLQDPYGGPNYFTLDPTANYEIHIDNDGDAVEDFTFRFRFQNRLKDLQLPIGDPGAEIDVSVPLRNIGPISATDSTAQNDVEAFGLWVIEGPTSAPTKLDAVLDAGTGKKIFAKPIDNIGTKSIPDYPAYADAFVYDIQLPDGSVGRMFVGQRQDPFVVNLGETFDLINLDPLGPPDAEENSLADKNITSLILEVPKSFLRGDGSVIGGWTTASLPRTRTLLPNPTYAKPADVSTDFQQVSRLGMPLVNEVVIGLPDKNQFNFSRPADDAQFLDYVLNPALPELIEVLFPVTAPNLFPRADLIEAFLTGIAGVNDNGSFAEMLRLNLDTPSVPAALQGNLGVLSGDLAGFPNGRRPGDDVVDITLRVAMGVLLDPTVAPSGGLPYTDGAFIDALVFDDVFPYLNDPTPGSPAQ
ncbi:MAG: DUF4331 domain-containing protein [Planctomycetota bacterium]